MHNTEIKTENVTGEAGVTMTNGDLGVSRHNSRDDGGGQHQHQHQHQNQSQHQQHQNQNQQQQHPHPHPNSHPHPHPQNTGHGSTVNGVTVAQNGTSTNVCAGCDNRIVDRFLLKALDMYWHEDCLKCSCCCCRLGEVGSTLYTKANLILCRRDYLRLFGNTGYCSACNKVIPAFEMVMRARSNVYHLECFACQQCQHRFCVGDKYYLCENKILCEYDYEERMVFANMAYSGNLALLRRQVSNFKQSGPSENSQLPFQQQQSQPQQQHQHHHQQQQYQQFNEPQFEFPLSQTPVTESFRGSSSSPSCPTNSILTIKSEGSPFPQGANNNTNNNNNNPSNNNPFLNKVIVSSSSSSSPSHSHSQSQSPLGPESGSNKKNLAKTANPKISKTSTPRVRNRNRAKKTPTTTTTANNKGSTNNSTSGSMQPMSMSMPMPMPMQPQSTQFQFQPSALIHGDEVSNGYGSPDSGIVEGS